MITLASRNHYSRLLLMLLAIGTFSPFTTQAADKAVKTLDIERQDVIQYEPAFGTVVSTHNSPLATEVSGKIIALLPLGTQVSKGEIIARIDAAFLKLALEKAKASLGKAQAKRDHLKSRLASYRSLNKISSVTEDELRLVESQYRMSLHEIQEWQQDIADTEVRIARSELRAPFDGVITEHMTQLGAAVDRFDPIVRLLDNQHLVLHVEAPANLYHQIEPGQAVLVNYQQQEFVLEVLSRYPVEDFHSRKFIFRCRADSSFVIGSSATVQVPRNKVKDAFRIPFDALIKVKSGYEVAIVDQAQTVKKIQVDKLFHLNEEVVISGKGLPDKAEIVTHGNLWVTTGDSVKRL